MSNESTAPSQWEENWVKNAEIPSPNKSFLQEEKWENIRNTIIHQLFWQFSLSVQYNKCNLTLWVYKARIVYWT